MEPDSYDPMPLPYLESPPKVIPIDTGRQLFIDEFLIEYTDLKREFHQPVKYEGNPILAPKTAIEMNQGYCPTAVPFSDGCFYDPDEKLFKLWYMAGWMDGTALATSSDGLHWERPDLDVVPGTNLVLPSWNNYRRDGFASIKGGNQERILLTRPIEFSGKHLFVNVDGPQGRLLVEVCRQDGIPIPSFTRNDCIPIGTDNTKFMVTWKGGDNLESLAGTPVRMKFYLSNSRLYSFWVSKNRLGVSGGATAAGGPGLKGQWDR
jgi:hypothetical protein